MIPAWWLAIGSTLVFAGLLALYLQSDDSGFWLSLAGIAALAAFIFLLFAVIVSLSRHYGRVSCGTFSAQTHRPTRFVIYTSWDTGDCLTPDGRGHWIPTKNLREFGSKP